MCRECYTITAALNEVNIEDQVSFSEKWHLFFDDNSKLKIMARYSNREIIYSPFYLHSFKLVQPHFFADTKWLNIAQSDPSKITRVADKLRFFRLRKGLLQRDVADFAGLSHSTYIGYEGTGRDLYPIDKMKRIADLLEVPVIELLDDYNIFLYNGQGQQIKELRHKTRLNQTEYAQLLGVSVGMLKKWERDRVRIFKSTWANLFKK